MTLRLTSRQASDFTSALRTLLSPLTYPDLATWQREALGEVHNVVGAHHSSFWMPRADGELSVVGCNMDGSLVELVRQSQQRVPTGPSADTLMQHAARARDQRGSGVYHELDITDRETIERSPLYQDAFRPAGLCYTIGMSTPLSGGEGGIVIAFERNDVEGYEDGGLARLRLLLPAFMAGCSAAWRFYHRREEMARTLDALQEPILLIGQDGTLLFQNKAFTRMVSFEPQAEQLLSVARAHAEALHAGRFAKNVKTRKGGLTGIPSSAAYSTRAARYQLHGSYAGPALFGREGIIVSVRLVGRRAATTRHLEEQCGLSPREGEVARLVAGGLTNQDIAEALDISPHTVKHHVSHIMHKLNVASRSAVVTRLLRVD